MDVQGTLNSAQLLPDSWLDPRLEIRPSIIAGLGTFARTALAEGDVLIVWGGSLFTIEQIRQGLAKSNSLSGFTEGYYLGQVIDQPDSLDQFLNHSCDPNLWLVDQVTLVARRAVQPDEELTADYATWEIDPLWQLPILCRCGTSLCRREITGCDWEQSDIQHRYRGHFLPCIAERIQATHFSMAKDLWSR